MLDLFGAVCGTPFWHGQPVFVQRFGGPVWGTATFGRFLQVTTRT
ncbi:hypothetical protein [Streptomyces aureus]|uniref:Uncharacterized protein n=1 Tax=Streptomyces aureus TaxID=193461 RepID=A0ABV4SX52_9ACTN